MAATTIAIAASIVLAASGGILRQLQCSGQSNPLAEASAGVPTVLLWMLAATAAIVLLLSLWVILVS